MEVVECSIRDWVSCKVEKLVFRTLECLKTKKDEFKKK